MHLDLSHERIFVDCPKCNFWIRPFLREIEEERLVVCPGCRQNISLVDNLLSLRRSRREAEKAIRELENTLKNFRF